jgi:hypothetical protein
MMVQHLFLIYFLTAQEVIYKHFYKIPNLISRQKSHFDFYSLL